MTIRFGDRGGPGESSNDLSGRAGSELFNQRGECLSKDGRKHLGFGQCKERGADELVENSKCTDMTSLRSTIGYKGELGTTPNTTLKSLPSSQSRLACLEPTYRLSVRFRTYLAARDLLAPSAVITLAHFLWRFCSCLERECASRPHQNKTTTLLCSTGWP